jgi:DNA-binding LytR/AlgR family response regulator
MAAKKVHIVEDELIIARGMQSALERHGFEVTGISMTGAQACQSVSEVLPDVVLMDVEIKGEHNGIETARQLRILYPKLAIIFCTQKKDKVTFEKAKEAFPENFLTKPFSNRTLLYAVELAIQQASKNGTDNGSDNLVVTDGVFIPVDGYRVKILFKDILYIKAGGEYSKTNGGGSYSSIFFENHLADGVDHHYEVSMSSSKLVQQIDFPQLVQVHKSYYVNLDKIDRIGKGFIYIKDTEIPMGDKYNDDVLKNKIRSVRYDFYKK